MLYFYLGFYVAFNTVQVISRRVVEGVEETSTYSSSGFCTVNCRSTASNYQLSHLRGTKPWLPARPQVGKLVVTCRWSNVVKVVHTVPGHSQNKEISLRSADCYYHKKYKLKYVKGVSSVTQLSCVKPVKSAVSNLPVGARLQNYWQTWLDLGSGPKVVHIRREGYTLPFRI